LSVLLERCSWNFDKFGAAGELFYFTVDLVGRTGEFSKSTVEFARWVVEFFNFTGDFMSEDW
jgi:hypothetical protein